ncbi:uncharacterized protein F5147DRAFT_705927 [Suillus discolor]|uniref:Uncharacterized protein n=1 Tax=Suillus discolor TaxID=1912936 RepID=A0A9P7F1Q2_9AGAM|nr:uncharacterized protein F5147DRAFT_705927 [Suillus discolor]KAG2103432.1 hypothetical protein F5147DRAFT_705927 [Suillus discolor]
MMGTGLGAVLWSLSCVTSILTIKLTHQRQCELFDMTLDVIAVHTALTFTYAIIPCFIQRSPLIDHNSPSAYFPSNNDSISLVRLKSAGSLIYGSTYISLTIVPFPFLVQVSSLE